MSCPYFKEGYVGACTASEPVHTPSIARMEIYCFSDGYRFCPDAAARVVDPEDTEVDRSRADSFSDTATS